MLLRQQAQEPPLEVVRKHDQQVHDLVAVADQVKAARRPSLGVVVRVCGASDHQREER